MRRSLQSLAVPSSVALCLVLAACVLPANAQLYTGSIAGMMTDPSGAVVVSAHVTATDVDRITVGSAEYVWQAEGERGHAEPDGPPSQSRVSGSAETLYKLPMASITVLRGSIGDQ
jgi:hypothetical protein